MTEVAVPNQLSLLMSGAFPPQRAFRYDRSKWLDWLVSVPQAVDVLTTLPDAVDRSTASLLFEESWPSNVPGAFVAAMVWGHGTRNYGPFRVARILTQSEAPQEAPLDVSVVDRLRASVEIVRTEGAVEGYRYLNNEPGLIPHLGPAFFTKWLYFASVTGPGGVASGAPVLDRLVINWLAEHGISIRSGRTRDYDRYCSLLADWGRPYSLAPVEVEERIFRLIRNDGGEQ